MAAESDRDGNIFLASTLDLSHITSSMPSTSRLPPPVNQLSRPSSLNLALSAPHSSSLFDIPGITPKVETMLWGRYKPIVDALQEPLDRYLQLDITYKECIQKLVSHQKKLMHKEISRNEIDAILDDVEKELLFAQYLALWKRCILLNADKTLYRITGKKCAPKDENPATIKTKGRTKKTAVSTVKDIVRRSKRERSSPCAVKIKSKDMNRNSAASTPRQNSYSSNTSRSKKKGKSREVGSDSNGLAKKRTSGRIAKALRKKQPTPSLTSEVSAPVAVSDEPTYCLCQQVSFGEMIGCDNDKCTIEWFHFGCVQLKAKPKGKWYCPLCRGDRTNTLKSSTTK